jgi:hypothetical protein
MWNMKWFVYFQIIDISDNIDWKDLICAHENYMNKSSWILCTIEHIKHHENHNHKSFCLIPSLFLNLICNPKQLKSALWDLKKYYNENI